MVYSFNLLANFNYCNKKKPSIKLSLFAMSAKLLTPVTCQGRAQNPSYPMRGLYSLTLMQQSLPPLFLTTLINAHSHKKKKTQ